MCGIIGYWPFEPAVDAEVKTAFRRLLTESRVRGMHAYGLGWDRSVFRSFDLRQVVEQFNPDVATVAHTRYALSGDWQVMMNNQPLLGVGTGITLAFNGVIHMGTKSEFEQDFGVSCATDNDGEVFIRRVAGGQDPADFLRDLDGSFAGVWLRDGRLFAARNERRPLWTTLAYGARWFASTRDIFLRAGFPEAFTPLDPLSVWVCKDVRNGQ
jgi:asparagine synthetase B (glutamine-hydrolysing)